MGRIHVLDVHGRPERLALRPCSFLEDPLYSLPGNTKFR